MINVLFSKFKQGTEAMETTLCTIITRLDFQNNDD
jgi:hypothetical protein